MFSGLFVLLTIAGMAGLLTLTRAEWLGLAPHLADYAFFLVVPFAPAIMAVALGFLIVRRWHLRRIAAAKASSR